MLTNSKIVVSGNSIELVISKQPIQYGYKNPTRKKVRHTDPEKIKENRVKTRAQSKRQITRLIRSNNYYWNRRLGVYYNPAFITITFHQNIQDLIVANREFSKFIQRLNHLLNRKNDQRLKYLGVIEFQDRGAIHYHIIVFDLPYIPNLYNQLKKLWKHGSIVHRSVKNVNDLSGYITKYLTKESEEDKLIGHKSFFSSRGLVKPQVIRDPEKVMGIAVFLQDKHKVFQRTFVDERLGEVEYTKYELPYDDTILQKIN